MKLSLDSFARSQFICDFHKSKIQSEKIRSKRHQRAVNRDTDSGSDSETGEMISGPDFYSLQVQTLRRYKKYYKVSTRPGLNKAQLAEIVSKHFLSIPVKEKEILAFFIFKIKKEKEEKEKEFC